MPELPEVETVVRDLRPLLTGTRITAVRAGAKQLRKPWLRDWDQYLLRRRIDSVSRRGKWIVLNLARGSHLVIHLGMTGQLQVMDASQPLAAHTHLVLDLERGRQLRFRDVRRFGSATWFADHEALEQFFAATALGPEPFALDPARWRLALGRTARYLKAVLLDQHVVAGVGNIYADEALFQARLHPGSARSGPRRCRGAPVAAGHCRGADPGHRAARLLHSRLRWRLGPEGRVSERVPRLRTDQPALPALPHRHRPHPPGRTLNALLPQVPTRKSEI